MEQELAVGYGRKSPDDPEDTKTSIDNQKKAYLKTCEENNWKDMGFYFETQISGSDRTRPEFLKFLKILLETDINIGVTKAQDRLGRDIPFILDILKKLKNRDKKIYSIIQRRFLDRDNLEDIFKGVIDERYITDQRNKADLLLEQKKSEGKPIGNPIFGYKYNHKFNSSGKKVPIDKERDIDEWIIEKPASKIVLRVVSDYLQNKDYKATMKDLKINKSKYYRILKNAKNGLYSGQICYQRKFKDPDKSVARIDEVNYKGTQEKILETPLDG